MEMWKSIVLGLVQGITEFLPVSSFGHLVITCKVLGIRNVPILFDILLHVATLLVVVWVLRGSISRIITSLFSSLGALTGRLDRQLDASEMSDLRFVMTIIIATICTGIIGLGTRSLGLQDKPRLVFVSFIVTGFLLLSTLMIGDNRSESTGEGDARVLRSRMIRQGVVTGVAQGLGTFPGISRSGSTITAALWTGMSREKAGEYSFLLSIPAILAALVLEIVDYQATSIPLDAGNVIVGMVSAAIAGSISLNILLKIIRDGKLYLFSIYLFPLGIVGLLLL